MSCNTNSISSLPVAGLMKTDIRVEPCLQNNISVNLMDDIMFY